jgi:membrane protein implicated in regulation of membrane protease activity
MPDWAWWLVITVALLAGEVVVFNAFILGPLSLASAAAALVAAGGASVEVQLAVFAVGGVLTLLLLRPLAKKHLYAPTELRTNVDALIGKQARVLRAMDFDTPGLVRIDNEQWTASPAPGTEKIDEGALVTVVEIKGATAVVEPVQQEADSQ